MGILAHQDDALVWLLVDRGHSLFHPLLHFLLDLLEMTATCFQAAAKWKAQWRRWQPCTSVCSPVANSESSGSHGRTCASTWSAYRFCYSNRKQTNAKKHFAFLQCFCVFFNLYTFYCTENPSFLSSVEFSFLWKSHNGFDSKEKILLPRSFSLWF